MRNPFRAVNQLRKHVLSDLHYGLETGHGKDWVAIILALAISTGLVLLVIGGFTIQLVLRVPTSENVAQVLTNVVGGLVAILGSYVGYRASKSDDPPER